MSMCSCTSWNGSLGNAINCGNGPMKYQTPILDSFAPETPEQDRRSPSGRLLYVAISCLGVIALLGMTLLTLTLLFAALA